MTRWALRGTEASLHHVRPAGSSASLVEHIAASTTIAAQMRFLVSGALDSPGASLTTSSLPQPTMPLDAGADATAAVAHLAAETSALRRTWIKLTDAEREAAIELDGWIADVDGIARHCVHELLHRHSELGRLVDALAPHRASGTVASVHAGRGLPKPSIGSAHFGFRGYGADVQRDRKHHGRVWQAVCLWSAEVIEQLQGEGHPVFAGACGENVVLRGIDFAQLRSGQRLSFTSGLEIELTDFAPPCRVTGEFFADRNFRRIDERTQRGVSRLYATTLTDGTVREGDVATLH